MGYRMQNRKKIFILTIQLFCLLAGCASVTKMADLAGVKSVAQMATVVDPDAKYISGQQASSIEKSAEAVGKTFEDITPEQEYYIGRAVAATVLETYNPLDKKEFNRYLNEVGQTLAQASDRPETFSGYHFLTVDSDEINAFAAPGGLILVTRGLVRCCASEDALAAVLAHEIGHVAKKHGLKAIKKGRLTSALTTLASEGAKNLGNDELSKLTEDFQGSISDITSTMMNSGYARTLETEADDAAVTIMQRAGYDPNAFIAMLEQMKKTSAPKSGSAARGFAKTHPDPQTRINAVKARIGNLPAAVEPAPRRTRFEKAVSGL
jgi:beta-barrel assembly-enhancing protease